MSKSRKIQIPFAVLSLLVALAGVTAISRPQQARSAPSEALSNYRAHLCSVQCVGERSYQTGLDAYRAQVCQIQCLGRTTFEEALNSYRESLSVFQSLTDRSSADGLEAYRANLCQVQCIH
jgi:hypothetical protein